jgi:hypothetical protein
MEFSIPQFIEREPKIIGPLTLKQFIYIGSAGGLALILYFTIPFFYFILASIVLVLSALALAFLNINGIPLPTVIKNFLFFSIAPRIYIWKKTEFPLYKKVVEKKLPKRKVEETKEEAILKAESESNLKKLRTHIELGV